MQVLNDTLHRRWVGGWLVADALGQTVFETFAAPQKPTLGNAVPPLVR